MDRRCAEKLDSIEAIGCHMAELRRTIGGGLVPTFGELVQTLTASMGSRFDGRRRKKRIAKKAQQRNGYRRHDSLGALLALEAGR